MCIEEESKIIIFGSGDYGKRALDFLGSKNISCFCDNDLLKIGTTRYGKKVISFEELKEKYSKSIIVIAVIEFQAAYKIAEQCEKNNIPDYLVYGFPAELFREQRYTLNYIRSCENRLKIRKKLYLRKIEMLEDQITYFKQHTDIQHMLPASGMLRERQMNTVKVAAEFWKGINGLGIKPILDFGSLLGYVRHNGFIPWDDDMDFSLIRKEYDQLKEYCQKHIYTIKEFFDQKRVVEKYITPGLEDYYWVDSITQITINKYCPESHSGFDIFSLEYYKEGYSLAELKNFAAEVWHDFLMAPSFEEKARYMEAARMTNKYNTAEESDSIYFGIDNVSMLLSNQYHRGSWISKKVVFPLKEILFEGEYFWVPNDPEEYLKYDYKDIWEFPGDAGLSKHIGNTTL